MGGFIRGLMAKKIRHPVITSPPPIITVITSYLLDNLGNVLTGDGNRLVAK